MQEKNPVAGWDFKECCIEPLLHLEDQGDQLSLTMDLPGVRKEDIEVSVTENSLEVKAIMGKTYRFERWGTVQKSVEFKSFHKALSLPATIDVENTSSRFRAGILEITLPKKHKKTKIVIE